MQSWILKERNRITKSSKSYQTDSKKLLHHERVRSETELSTKSYKGYKRQANKHLHKSKSTEAIPLEYHVCRGMLINARAAPGLVQFE